MLFLILRLTFRTVIRDVLPGRIVDYGLSAGFAELCWEFCRRRGYFFFSLGNDLLQKIKHQVSSSSHRRSDLDQIAIQIIEADHLLPPTVCHQPVDRLNLRVELLELLDEPFNI